EFKLVRDEIGGVAGMSIDEIREIYLKEEGREEERRESEKKLKLKQIELAKNLLDILDDDTIAKKMEIDIEIVRKLRAGDKDTIEI
ncbi:MAG: hypothetical protein ACRC30_02215, partial [Clostridium sp.]